MIGVLSVSVKVCLARVLSFNDIVGLMVDRNLSIVGLTAGEVLSL